jgi:hypothetical protein
MPDTYKMTVNLTVLDHLGINLYINIAAVLTYAMSNAFVGGMRGPWNMGTKRSRGV